MPSKYQTDYYAWTTETATALQEGRVLDVDLLATAEEIADLGRSERRSLESAVAQLFPHLLRTQYQPGLATTSWEISTYQDAVLEAMAETGLPEAAFPVECPFGIAEIQKD